MSNPAMCQPDGIQTNFLSRFPAATEFDSQVPIARIAQGRIIHRFFDRSSISPSGRYAGLFRLPTENRSPGPGDVGEVVLVDLHTGEERSVAQSRGWEVQMGANVQWGSTDDALFFNDVDVGTWTPFAVRLDPATGGIRRFDGTVFTVSPDGSQLASYNLASSHLIQPGYGVILPKAHVRRNKGPVDDDGIFITQVALGRTVMIASIRDIYQKAVPSFEIAGAKACEFYCFQVRWNPQGTRLMTFLRWRDPDTTKRGRKTLALVTLKPDGSDIRIAVSAEQYARGGHHPMWTPDGEHITINLRMGDGPCPLALVRVRYDGTGLESLHPVGSGHPSQHPTLPFIITDAYSNESMARPDGSVPLRLIDLRDGSETALAWVLAQRSESASLSSLFRIDQHPAWDNTGRFIVFNGVHRDTRAVYIADLGEYLHRAMLRP